MKNVCIIALLVMSAPSYAQVFGMNDWDFQYMEYVPIRYYPVTNVSKITFSELNKKNEVIETYVKEFNSEGIITSYETRNKKNEVLEKVLFAYNEANHITEMKRNKKGELKLLIDFAYTKDDKPLYKKRFDGKGKSLKSTEWIYNEQNCLKSYVLYKKGGKKIEKRWEHEYREECDRSKSTVYNGKGKVLNVWTYDCKSEGEKLVKKKNETQVCRWEEVDAHTITKVYQIFDEKGRIVKNVSKYTAGDTLILEWARYNEDDQLTYKTTYDKDYKKVLRSTSYKKGKDWYDTEITYDNGRIVSKRRSKKGNLYGVSEYTYNEDGLLSEYLATRGNGKMYSSYSLTYD